MTVFPDKPISFNPIQHGHNIRGVMGRVNHMTMDIGLGINDTKPTSFRVAIDGNTKDVLEWNSNDRNGFVMGLSEFRYDEREHVCLFYVP
jgi:hypothetical protein